MEKNTFLLLKHDQGMGDYCFKELSVRFYRGARMSDDELNKITEVLNQKEKFDSKIDTIIL